MNNSLRLIDNGLRHINSPLTKEVSKEWITNLLLDIRNTVAVETKQPTNQIK